MLSDTIAAMLRGARQQVKLSQAELARRSRVSTRLAREFETGKRPEVSLQSALRLLEAAGVSIRLTAPDGTLADIRGASVAALERAARAVHRRATWIGGHAPLERSGAAPSGGTTAADRLVAVARVSRQAHLLARAGRTSGTAAPVPRRAAAAARVGATAAKAGTARSPRTPRATSARAEA